MVHKGVRFILTLEPLCMYNEVEEPVSALTELVEGL